MNKNKEKNRSEEEAEDIIFEEEIDEDGQSDPIATIKKLRQKIKVLEEKSQEYLTGWQRERADAINLKKRLEEEKRDFAKFAKEDIATELMSVLDSFESAFKNKEVWEKVDKNWRIGIEHIHNQLISVLSNHGISIISPLGEIFDPKRDEAVEVVPVKDKKDDQKIVEVTSIGYKIHDRIIRAPKVKVGEFKVEN